ncbi:ATP-binding protein [Streptomyces sp. NPDC003077]|uniref:ATP-binding protein n=1 Tax=Streptomyces sp. NPDC003077 TaxID=3154443 RepID=UPI0033AD434F
MSLPLSRRIARAALLVAAGAAPLVGAAGSAHAVELHKGPDLAGLTAVDPGNLADTADRATQETTGLAGEVGSQTVRDTVPAAGKTGGTTIKRATPAVQKLTGETARHTGQYLGSTTQTATHSGLVEALPTSGMDGDTLPTRELLHDGVDTEKLLPNGKLAQSDLLSE